MCGGGLHGFLGYSVKLYSDTRTLAGITPILEYSFGDGSYTETDADTQRITVGYTQISNFGIRADL